MFCCYALIDVEADALVGDDKADDAALGDETITFADDEGAFADAAEDLPGIFEVMVDVEYLAGLGIWHLGDPANHDRPAVDGVSFGEIVDSAAEGVGAENTDLDR